MTELRRLENPSPDTIPEKVEDWLLDLGQPTEIFISGADTNRSRALVTLLHGNEPSGLMAIHRWLRGDYQPAVNMLFIIASVPAALISPVFSHRVYPNWRDLNRCFRKPYDDLPGQLAHAILASLHKLNPEAVVDMHNTSGSGPSFGVVTHMDSRHDSLTSIFTRRLVVTSLRIGALMEISEHLFPTVTIECGGARDWQAHELAWQGLQRYATLPELLSPPITGGQVEVLYNPVRLELHDGCSLAYGTSRQGSVDLTLRTDLEQFNFGKVAAGTRLGWVSDKGLSLFVARNSLDNCVLNDLIQVRHGELYTAVELILFMITSNPEIAVMDCLFYAVRVDGIEIGIN